METKTAFITIAGRTNAGKSSLLNALIGEKIAIISDKTQTTRTRITGLLNVEGTQLVFMDTPGLHKAKNKLSEYMLNSVKESASGVDVVLFVFDCTRRMGEQEKAMISNLINAKTPVVLVLNKIDLLDDKALLAKKLSDLCAEFDFDAVIPVSVIENDGVDLVLEQVLKYAAPSPHYFPDDKLTDRSETYLAAEMVREKLLMLLKDEVPHGIAVEIEKFAERDNKDILDVHVVIYCEKSSHKGIVIGKNGAMLKKIATMARRDLEDFFRIQVNLQCFVKVREDWRNRDGIIRSLGLGE
ncbi:MAG: GTPase Era [Oscillospiraceae bacterium]|nr:GTPase Era [Oscillospiraceae bacterium]